MATEKELQHIYKEEGFVLDEDQQLGMTHFLMMGANLNTQGVYSEEDVKADQTSWSGIFRQIYYYDGKWYS